jgi:hypothetical protein
MTIMNTLTKLSLFVLTFSAVVLCAQTKPNFSGTWELNVGKSELDGAPITRLLVQIEQRRPVFKYTAKGTADGQDFEETEALATDGKPGHDSHGNAVTTHWEGATLISEFATADRSPLYEAHIMLSADGRPSSGILSARVQTTRKSDTRSTKSGEPLSPRHQRG